MEGVIEQLWTVVMGECWAWQVMDFFGGGDAHHDTVVTVSTD